MADWTPPLLVGHDGTLSDEAGDARGSELFEKLQLLQPTTPPEGAWVLAHQHRAGQAVPLLELIRPDGVRLSIDFSGGKALHRAREAGKGIQPLARALGISAYRKRYGDHPGIIDATGGLGQDAWALATLGLTVTVIERHPIVHALLANALARARDEPLSEQTARRITLLHGQAEPLLPNLDAHAIYLDPMYPERARRKAGSRKGMQFLHALLGPPQAHDSDTLLMAALNARVNRVVVKRPRGAERLAGSDQWRGQLTCVESPKTRYDVYHRHPA